MEADQKYQRKIQRAKKALVLQALLLTCAQVVSLGLLAMCEREPVEQVRKELLGLEYLEPLRRLQELLPVYPDKVAEAARGGEAAREAFLMHEEEIQRLLHRLENIDRLHGVHLATTEDLVHLLDLWKGLRKARGRPEEEARLHQEVHKGVRSMIGLVGDASDLVLDPEIQTYYLIDSLVNRLSEGAELLNAARRLEREDAVVDSEREAAFLARELQKSLQQTSRNYRVSFDKEESSRFHLERPLRVYESRLVSLIDLLDRRSRPGERIPPHLSKTAESALIANSRLFARTLPQVQRLLEARRTEMEGRRMHRMAYVVPFLAAGFLLVVWGARSKKRPPQASGDIESTARQPSAAPGENLEQENQQLKLLVAELCLANRSLRRQAANPSP